MAQRKHLRAELGVGAGADEDQVGEEASELVREAWQRILPDLPDRPSAAKTVWPGPAGHLPSAEEAPIRTDAGRFTPHAVSRQWTRPAI